MKIAIISDIHGNLQALKAITSDIKQKTFDKVICLGDTIAIGPNPKECLELILDEGYQYILGNHEEYFIKGTDSFPEIGESEAKHQEWVMRELTNDLKQKLNEKLYTVDIEYGGKKYSFIHYARKEGKFIYIDEKRNADNLDKMFSDVDSNVIIYGHEHHLEQTIINGKKTYICVGSSGCRKDNKTYYTMLTLDEDKYELERVNLVFDKKAFVDTLDGLDYPDKEFISEVFFGVKK